MIYEKRLLIPKLTQEAAKVEATCEIHPGTVKQLQVYFPPGCAALAHVQIYYWDRQVWPTNPNSDFTGDNTLLSFPENLIITGAPFEFVIKGWNDDDTYPHTAIVRFHIDADTQTIGDLIKLLSLGPQGPATPVE
jgi:hypothetical protein